MTIDIPGNPLAFVGPFYPFRGGIAHFSEALARAMEKRGHAVSAITFSRQYPVFLFPGTSQFETEARQDAREAARLIDTLNPLTWVRAAARLIRQRPDAVVFSYWMPFFAPAYGTAAWLLRTAGVRVLCLAHNALPHERRPGDLLLSRFFLRAVEGFIVLSAAVEEDLRKLGVTAPIRRVAHPLYDQFGAAPAKAAAREALGLPPEAPTLLFFGFVRRYKGLHVLLEALPLLVETLPDVRLVVAGEFYEDEAPYREQIRRHGLEKHVHLHSGYVPNEAVPRYFAAADLVVQPYTTATQSGVAQIAFNYEKPIVVTDVGGLAEVVPHERAGLVVPPDDPVALADAIRHFFEDNLQATLVEGVRHEKQKYSWDRVVEAMEALIAAQ